jgi:hypothetical protein
MASLGGRRAVPSVRIIYGVDGRADHDDAAVLQRYAPGDFDVSIAPLHDPDGAAAEVALGSDPVDLVLLLCELNAPAIVDALRRRRWNSKLIVRWSFDFPKQLELLYALRSAADAWIFSDAECWRGSGRLPRTHIVPGGVDCNTFIFELCRNVIRGWDDASRCGPDLSRHVTVFVTSVGAATATSCLEHLREQDCTFTLRLIEGVAPMNAAFQRMLDECRTPYYVQVDEDMLLYPHAIRTLYESMTDAAPYVAMIIADLYDIHLECCIIGLKIFRHDIVRRYPLRSMESFEIDQVLRFEADGYKTVIPKAGLMPLEGQTLGVHGTHWTPSSIYQRYVNVERRRRRYPERMAWFEPYAAVFLQRFLADPIELNFFALMGVLAGTLAPPATGAKDFRTYGATDGFPLLRQWFDAMRGMHPVERGNGSGLPAAE